MKPEMRWENQGIWWEQRPEDTIFIGTGSLNREMPPFTGIIHQIKMVATLALTEAQGGDRETFFGEQENRKKMGKKKKRIGELLVV